MKILNKLLIGLTMVISTYGGVFNYAANPTQHIFVDSGVCNCLEYVQFFVGIFNFASVAKHLFDKKTYGTNDNKKGFNDVIGSCILFIALGAIRIAINPTLNDLDMLMIQCFLCTNSILRLTT